jgi:hypothetical protein
MAGLMAVQWASWVDYWVV